MLQVFRRCRRWSPATIALTVFGTVIFRASLFTCRLIARWTKVQQTKLRVFETELFRPWPELCFAVFFCHCACESPSREPLFYHNAPINSNSFSTSSGFSQPLTSSPQPRGSHILSPLKTPIS